MRWAWTLVVVIIIGLFAIDYFVINKDPVVSSNPNSSDIGLVEPELNLTMYELTNTDVLRLMDDNLITSKQVTVFGIKLGDPPSALIKKMGAPQYIDDFGDVVNFKYEAPNTNETIIIFHMVNDEIKRIVIREGMQQVLINESRLGMNLRNITDKFGKPDKTQDTIFVRTYSYDDLGLEINHRRKIMNSYAFVPVGGYNG